MTLKPGIPEPIEFPLSLSVTPKPIKTGVKEQLLFEILDPQTGRPVTNFQTVHEKLFHMFIVSEDLQYFVHDHPVLESGGKFTFATAFPRPGMYRVLGDFYPDGATPQLSSKTVVVSGGAQQPPRLTKDYGPKQAGNTTASITTAPTEPIAGAETRIFLHIETADGLEQYLGAWAHVLAASDDLIDLIHTHPFAADGSQDMEFHLYLGREHVYRIWFQFQRKGVVNTVFFDVPVSTV
jgi:hypothetical protein